MSVLYGVTCACPDDAGVVGGRGARRRVRVRHRSACDTVVALLSPTTGDSAWDRGKRLIFPPRFAYPGKRYAQSVSTGETLRSRLLPRVGNDETMNYGVKAFYPASLAAVDIAIGTGFLHVRGPSPIGLLMSLLGVIIVCHALYSAARQADSAVHRTASESEETVPSRPDEASVKTFARPVFQDDAACGVPVPSRCHPQREASRRRCRRPHSPRPRPPALECGEYVSVSARSGIRR